MDTLYIIVTVYCQSASEIMTKHARLQICAKVKKHNVSSKNQQKKKQTKQQQQPKPRLQSPDGRSYFFKLCILSEMKF